MVETDGTSDLSIGASMLLGFVVVLAAVATAWTALLAESQGSESLQLLSGVALAVALLAGGLTVAGIHLFE